MSAELRSFNYFLYIGVKESRYACNLVFLYATKSLSVNLSWRSPLDPYDSQGCFSNVYYYEYLLD